MSDEDILYEVKQLHQWKLDREPVYSDESKLRVFKQFDPRRFLPERNKDIPRYYNSQLPWQFAVSNPDRSLLAVLQEKYLEIRHKRDDYEKPIGRITVPEDECPQWRKLTWSSDGVCIAISMSHGELRCYNTYNTLICSIPKIDGNYDSSATMPNGALASLFLIDARTKNAEWPYELIAIDFNGYLRSYFVSSNEGYKPYHTFSFGETLLTSASYISTFNILVVAFPRYSLSPQSSGDTLGLSSWRMLIDYPYYRLTKPDVEDLMSLDKRPSWFSLLTRKGERSVVLKMSVSLNVKFLACMHSCGTVSVWTLPHLSMYRLRPAQNLPLYDVAKEKKTCKSECDSSVLIDIGWCLDSKLVIFYDTGILTVSDLDSPENLLARINSKCHVIERQPEVFFPPVRLANICDMAIGFLVLNHERKEFSSWRRESDASDTTSDSKMDDDSISKSVDVIDNHSMLRQLLKFFIHFEMFHQQKQHVCLFVEKTYKLTALKKVTPEELYEQKINSEEYADALDFAKLFGLDENRVYKKQWLNSVPVTTASIHNHLLKISDKKWIIHQCCERIPETLEPAEVLLKKGLEYTDFSEFILDDQDLENENPELYELPNPMKFEVNFDKTTAHFTKNQLHILKLRKYLLAYLDALTIYKKIFNLGDESKTYDSEEYRKFRIESPLSLALNFAHNANAEAIYVLFSYYTEELHPHWLEVLDNIPECVPPSSYKKLLPKFNEQHELQSLPSKRIRPAEWSESGEFKELLTKKTSSSRGYSTFSRKEIAEWYQKKIRKIVDESGLIDYALELLNLASTNNISGLENLRHNLLVLDALTYKLLLDEQYSLTEMERRTDLEKLVLLMSEFTTRESFKVAVAEILLPFLNRCEMLRSNSRDALLDAYFQRLSENDLMLPLTFFEYLTDKDKDHLLFSAKKKLELRLLCVYSCKRTDQVDVALKIIEFEPEFSDNNNSNVEETMNLRSRLTELHTELVTMQLLRTYGCEKNITFLHSNKLNEQFQKDVFTIMVNFRINTNAPSLQEIHSLFDDMTYVQEQIFNALPQQTYLRIFAYTILTAGRADYIEKYASFALCCGATRKLSMNQKNLTTLTFSESVAIIVEAAQYYFNIASSYEDVNMSLAKICLSLVTFHPDLEPERKLIDALKIMNDFGVHITPLKVRMCVDYKKMLQKVLKTEPKAYRRMDQLISLATKLVNDENVSRNDLELEVLNLAVEAAFKLKDYAWSSSTILKLMEAGKSCWNLCKKLCQSEEYDDLEMKEKLIKYALMLCPDKELIFLIEFRNKIECQLLQRKLKKCIKEVAKQEDVAQTDDFAESSKETTESFQNLISVPALMNMLHTSSSHVLNVNFWKNTFNLNLESYLDGNVSHTKTDCDKLAFSEFYGDVQASKSCIFNRDVGRDTEIFQQLLRFYLLRAKDSELDTVVQTDFEDVIGQYAIASFSNDCLLCLSLLTLCKDAESSTKVFSSLPDTAVVEKFALYYYSLKFLVSRNIEVHNFVTDESPSEVVLRALEEAKGVDSDYAKLVRKYSDALDKRKGINKLQDLGCGIDSSRFFTDETYKIDSVLGLAMYEDRDKLDLALSLGAEHGVQSEQIMLSHIKSLFLSGDLELLKSRLRETDVIEILKKNPSFTVERLTSDVYNLLSGCDYQNLLIYYALLNQIAEFEIFYHMKPMEHVKLLKQFNSFTKKHKKKIDYKLITAENPQVLEALIPAVFMTDLSSLIKFLKSLPAVIQEKIVFRDVFEQIALLRFFNDAHLTYEERFKLLIPLLEEMDENLIISIMQKVLFSKQSSENIGANTKRALLDFAIEIFSERYAENENDVIGCLKNFSHQLVKMEEFNEICKAIDIDETYLRELEEAVISDKTIQSKDTIVRMVLDLSVSADVINVILEFVRAGSLPDFITELLKANLSKDSVEPLLHRIENCLEDNEYERCWNDQLKSRLLGDPVWQVHETYIKKILAILELSDDDIYNTVERLHETRLILRKWVAVHSHITLFDVIDEESRLALFEQLVRQASSLSQFHCLVNLLNFWPRFADSPDWDKNPWLLLSEKVLALKEDEIPGIAVLNLFQEIIVHANLTKEVKRAFFEYIGSVPHNKVLMVWFCILSDDDLLVQSVSGYIDDLRRTRTMPKEIEEYLKRVHSS